MTRSAENTAGLSAASGMSAKGQWHAMGQKAKFRDDQRMSALAGTSKVDISRSRPSCQWFVLIESLSSTIDTASPVDAPKKAA
jgi:hypothetical protein